MARELIDLHIHVGGAVAPHILWSIAHQQGFKLPVKNYFEFVELITARARQGGQPRGLPEDHAHLDGEDSDLLRMAIERSIYEVIGKEYRGSRVTQIELRFNPMKRNLHSELDLDHIIHAALRGMDRAVLEYGVKACLIFCLAREFDHKLNAILVEKAIKYRTAACSASTSPAPRRTRWSCKPEVVAQYEDLFERARKAGLQAPPCTPARRRAPAPRA